MDCARFFLSVFRGTERQDNVSAIKKDYLKNKIRLKVSNQGCPDKTKRPVVANEALLMS
jgi:hypothetical protein